MTTSAAALHRKQLPPTSRPAATQVVRSAQKKAAVMRWMRKVHLYSGLGLLPWVLIYGISGFLFNHGGSSSSPRMLPIPPQDAPERPANEAAFGERLLVTMGERPTDFDASLSGAWSFDFSSPDDGSRYRLSMPVDAAEASLTERTARTSTTITYPRNTFADAREAAEFAAAATLERSGVPHASLRVTSGPSLRIQQGDRRWFTTLTRDRVSESHARAFDFGRLMRRLHVTHGYGRDAWSRVIWAVFVDVMAAAMVLWAVTGVAMWWQKKSLRAAGGAVIAAAFGGGVLLILCLQAQFNN